MRTCMHALTHAHMRAHACLPPPQVFHSGAGSALGESDDKEGGAKEGEAHSWTPANRKARRLRQRQAKFKG